MEPMIIRFCSNQLVYAPGVVRYARNLASNAVHFPEQMHVARQLIKTWQPSTMTDAEFAPVVDKVLDPLTHIESMIDIEAGIVKVTVPIV